MSQEHITDGQAFCTLAFFIMGSTLIIGTAGEAKNDMWISIALAIAAAIPLMLVYARVISLFPGRDLFEMLHILLGKFMGKLVMLLYIWYAFHLGALVIRNFGEFINTVAMPETPFLIPMLFIGVLSIWAVKAGIEVIGRSTIFLMPIIMVVTIIIQLLAIPEYKFHFLKPVLSNGWGPVLKGAFSAFSFPFGETVLFTGIFYSLRKRNSAYKVYLGAALFSGGLLVFVTIRNIVVLGANMVVRLYFPSYVAASRVNIGDFIQRIEVTVAIIFVTAAFVKISICLLAACNGIGKLFGLQNYRSVVMPVGLLMVYLAYFIYDSISEMQLWAFKIYPIYALPFQVILPVLIWITAEIKTRKRKAPAC